MTNRSPTASDSPFETSGPRSLWGSPQLAVLRAYGTEHNVRDGEILFSNGEQTYDMIVVLEGTVDILKHRPAKRGRAYHLWPARVPR